MKEKGSFLEELWLASDRKEWNGKEWIPPSLDASEIAELLERDWKSVLRDLKYLEGFGLVELIKEGRRRIVDIVSKEQVMAFT